MTRYTVRGTLAKATSQSYVHGPDLTITRANIELAQLRRTGDGLPPLTADELVRDFIHFPEPRHYARAYRLMAGVPAASAAKEP